MNTENHAKLEVRIDTRIKAIQDSEEFHDVILEFVTECGFSDYCMSAMDIKDDYFDFTYSSLPDELREFYNEFELAKYDILLDYLRWQEFPKPIFQSTIDNYVASSPYKIETIIKNKEIREESALYQFYDFLVIPQLSPLYSKAPRQKESGKAEGFFAVSRRGDNPTDFQKRAQYRLCEIEALSKCFYTFYSDRYTKLT